MLSILTFNWHATSQDISKRRERFRDRWNSDVVTAQDFLFSNFCAWKTTFHTLNCIVFYEKSLNFLIECLDDRVIVIMFCVLLNNALDLLPKPNIRILESIQWNNHHIASRHYMKHLIHVSKIFQHVMQKNFEAA